ERALVDLVRIELPEQESKALQRNEVGTPFKAGAEELVHPCLGSPRWSARSALAEPRGRHYLLDLRTGGRADRVLLLAREAEAELTGLLEQQLLPGELLDRRAELVVRGHGERTLHLRRLRADEVEELTGGERSSLVGRDRTLSGPATELRLRSARQL